MTVCDSHKPLLPLRCPAATSYGSWPSRQDGSALAKASAGGALAVFTALALAAGTPARAQSAPGRLIQLSAVLQDSLLPLPEPISLPAAALLNPQAVPAEGPPPPRCLPDLFGSVFPPDPICP